MGLIVQQAQDGFEALRKLDHETFDVVVSDIGMPGKRCRSGKAYPRQLRENSSSANDRRSDNANKRERS
jgi:CheY-like chemotaxis protein